MGRHTPPPSLLFLQARYEGQRGAVLLAYIDGDPLIEKITGECQEWFDWPRQAGDMARRCDELAARGVNTYLSLCVHSRRSRRYRTAHPSRWLWQDDAAPDVICTELVETSPGNYQAWIQLDRSIDATTRRALMAAWRDSENKRTGRSAAKDADDCSKNPVAFARIPGGHNTKLHGDHIVRIARTNDRTFNADRLLARIPQPTPGDVPQLDGAQLDAAARALQEAAQPWLDQIERLLTPDGRYPLGLKNPNTHSRKILDARHARRGFLFHSSGTWDASRERLWLANGLLLARYTDAQIAALIWHYELPETIRIKGAGAIWADIVRVIALAHAHWPHITPRTPGTVLTGRRAARPAAPAHRPAGDRQRGAAAVLAYIRTLDTDAFGRIPLDTTQIAGAVGKTRRMVQIYIGDLIKQGEITSGRYPGGRARWAILVEQPSERAPAQPDPVISDTEHTKLSSTSTAPTAEPICATETRQIAALDTVCTKEGETPDHRGGGCVSPPSAADFVSPSVEPPAPARPPTLAALVRDAIDAHGPRRRGVMAYLAANGGAHFPPEAVERVRKAELDRQRCQWQIDGLRTKKQVGLSKLRKQLDRILTGGPDGPEGARYKWAARYSPHVDAEIERRAPALERLKPRRKGQRNVSVDEALMLAEIAPQLDACRAETSGATQCQ